MKVELFTLCDAATNYHGKLNILGSFDIIWAQQTPVVHPQCAVALRIRFDKIEEDAHKLKIAIVDEDGRSIVPPLEGEIRFNIPDGEDSMAANSVLNFSGLKFPKFGRYSIDLAIDGRHEASLPLTVRKVEKVNAQPIT